MLIVAIRGAKPGVRRFLGSEIMGAEWRLFKSALGFTQHAVPICELLDCTPQNPRGARGLTSNSKQASERRCDRKRRGIQKGSSSMFSNLNSKVPATDQSSGSPTSYSSARRPNTYRRHPAKHLKRLNPNNINP